VEHQASYERRFWPTFAATCEATYKDTKHGPVLWGRDALAALCAASLLLGTTLFGDSSEWFLRHDSLICYIFSLAGLFIYLRLPSFKPEFGPHIHIFTLTFSPFQTQSIVTFEIMAVGVEQNEASESNGHSAENGNGRVVPEMKPSPNGIDVAIRANDAGAVSGLLKELSSFGATPSVDEDDTRLALLTSARALVRALETPRETMLKHNWAQVWIFSNSEMEFRRN
jgi:hypothetical protein